MHKFPPPHVRTCFVQNSLSVHTNTKQHPSPTITHLLSLLPQHWIANNIFGIAFSVNGVEMLHLNNVLTGVILLGGLFVYDVFWVFGTDVMVTVAKSFEAPIKREFAFSAGLGVVCNTAGVFFGLEVMLDT